MFYDEVDDVLAAAETLADLPEVDSGHVYLAGHSAGGTLTLLAAMSSQRFRQLRPFPARWPDQVAFARGREEIIPFDRNNPRVPDAFIPGISSKLPNVRCEFTSGPGDFFRASSQATASQKAKSAGLNVEAVSVAGDHFTAIA